MKDARHVADSPRLGLAVARRARDLLPLRLTFGHSTRLDLDQPIRINEPRHLHDRVGRTDRAEEFAMHAGHRFPILDAGEQGPCPNDLLE